MNANIQYIKRQQRITSKWNALTQDQRVKIRRHMFKHWQDASIENENALLQAINEVRK